MSKTKFIILSHAKDFEDAKRLVDWVRNRVSEKHEQMDIMVVPEIVALSDDGTFFNVLGFMKDSVSNPTVRVNTYKNGQRP